MYGDRGDWECRILDLEARMDAGWAWLKKLEVLLGSLGQSLSLAARSIGGGGVASPTALLAYTLGGSGYPTTAQAEYPVQPVNGGIALVAQNVGVAVPPPSTYVLVSVLASNTFFFQYDGGG